MKFRRMVVADLILVVVAFSAGALISAMWLTSSVPPAPQSRVVCVNFDISTPAGRGQYKDWHPVAPDKKRDIGLLVNAGAAQWMEAETLKCYERNPNNPRFGQLVAVHYLEWWKWIGNPKKTKRSIITH